MSSVRRLLVALAAIAALGGLAGCGEKDQIVLYQQGKYQGKPDTKPADNDPGGSLYTTSKWTKGDKASWEAAIKSRNQNQNEYTRAD